MTVEELIELLSNLDPQTKIAVAADAEGNQYSGLSDATLLAVDASWNGERTDEIVDPDDLEDDDDGRDLQDVVVLWPV